MKRLLFAILVMALFATTLQSCGTEDTSETPELNIESHDGDEVEDPDERGNS